MSRASTKEHARAYKIKGHKLEVLFAREIGLQEAYNNDPVAKKDVIDLSGDAHSVKGGDKKWQIFLYSKTRLLNDDGFQALNGVGSLLVHCIDAYPPTFEEHAKNKSFARERLKTPMKDIKDRLQRKALLRAFLSKAIFNSGEVNFLTIFRQEKFHVFLNEDVIQTFSGNFSVENSLGDQKVVFKHEGFNVAELEMRCDSEAHYQEVRLNMIIKKAFPLLVNNISPKKESPHSANIILYGKAINKFGKRTIWGTSEGRKRNRQDLLSEMKKLSII